MQPQIRMTSFQESLPVPEGLKKKIFALFDTIKKSLKEDRDTATPSQQELLSQLSQLEGLISELVEFVKENLDKKTNLEKQVKCFQEDLSDLQKRVKQLEGSDQRAKELKGSDKKKLLLGQLAFKLDRALLDKVLEDSECESAENLRLRYIKDMEDAINCVGHYASVFEDDERKRVELSWRKLRAKLGWKDKHYLALRNLKRLRRDLAHPKFSIEEITDAIGKVPESLSRQDKEICEEFIGMLDELQ